MIQSTVSRLLRLLNKANRLETADNDFKALTASAIEDFAPVFNGDAVLLPLHVDNLREMYPEVKDLTNEQLRPILQDISATHWAENFGAIDESVLTTAIYNVLDKNKSTLLERS